MVEGGEEPSEGDALRAAGRDVRGQDRRVQTARTEGPSLLVLTTACISTCSQCVSGIQISVKKKMHG